MNQIHDRKFKLEIYDSRFYNVGKSYDTSLVKFVKLTVQYRITKKKY